MRSRANGSAARFGVRPIFWDERNLTADYFVRCAVRTAMLKSCTSAPEMS
jgi:hypothetical protein